MAISRALRPVSPLCSSLALTLVACRPAASPSTAATTQPTAGLDTPPGASQSGAQSGPAGADEPRGSLDKDDIRKVVRAGIADVRACYNAGLASDPKLTGRVAIHFAIAGDGKVAQVAVQESTLPAWARSVADCIAAVAGRWQFPPPEGGGTITVLYPFVLEPG
ncbi:AgmX/PglI C-terminal domain-containing protein [Nannocystis sp. ILAH1]|uniref:AgmX/PglI C-terminal domain-containing protein n=1 Tax=Nannocystis sp. ILAH1 TaxID=2996789 RepID=UPI00226F6CA9|nr:AgmX/PglI C-terminal domain-containing protein [Nannocystis sp. ILAH1]